MPFKEIVKGVYSVGVNEKDLVLFDALIPLPDGTSYNSYLVRGSEKTALIDTVEQNKTAEFLANLAELKVSKIDYVVANHAERDHSGSLVAVLESFPGATLVTNAKCREMIQDSLPVPDEKFLVVPDRGTLSLGDRTLEFILAPWVHWPETMFTHLKEDHILFTCDFLGSHVSLDKPSIDESLLRRASKRYYAEIMMPYRGMARKALEKVRAVSPKIVAPSHGPVHVDPAPLIRLYDEWTSESVRNKVIVAHVSTHGHTMEMVRVLIRALEAKHIEVRAFNLPEADIGEIAIELVDAATLVMASPTILGGPHPQAVSATYLVDLLKPKIRFAAIIGSYGWGGKAIDELSKMFVHIKPEILGSVSVRGNPKDTDCRALDCLAETILQKHRSIGIAP
ncbi:MAG TPA: FprA family A-type flavoprotein [Elusimicrobiota bacterium]|nr:FprA family A-type flavoprotein [Elusimicrobiota bacterium]